MKQLVVVVHGVGVREAGVSSDQVTACLHESGTTGWQAQSSDDIHLVELPRYSDPQRFGVFRAHLRRFRHIPAPGSAPDKERLVADYYWGDISGTGQDVLRVITGFLRVVLGLSHVVRENAQSCYPAATPRDRRLRRLANAAALIIHGPIVALNIVILAGLFLAWGLEKLAGLLPQGMIAQPEALAAWALGAAAVAGGAVQLRKAQVFLLRHLGEWLLFTGLLVLGLAAGGIAGEEPLSGLAGRLHRILAEDACGVAEMKHACLEAYRGIERLGLWLMSAMVLAWAAVLACAWGGWLLALWRGRKPGDPGAVNIVLPTIALMALIWITTMAAVWYAVLQLPLDLVEDPDHVIAALKMVVLALVALAVLGIVGVRVHQAKRRALTKDSVAGYLVARDTLADRHRLIVSGRLMWVLRGFLLALCLVPPLKFAGLLDFDKAVVTWAMLVIGLAGLAMTGFARGAFAMGIGILADVVVYLNNYSWTSEQPARTLLERVLPDRSDLSADDARKGYWLRGRIRRRLHRLMRRLILQEQPGSIVLVAHSQGTMISIEALRRHGAQWRGWAPPGAKLALVTMGSPYTHLYNTYFPAAFPPVAALQDLRPVSATPPGLLDRWTNIFRIDDFVGTHIDTTRASGAADQGTGWPVEEPVGPGGHTQYWTDRNVIPKLRVAIKF